MGGYCCGPPQTKSPLQRRHTRDLADSSSLPCRTHNHDTGSQDDDFYSTGTRHCAQQVPFLEMINKLVAVRISFGVLGVCSCAAVLLVVFGNRRDRHIAARTIG